MRALCWDTETSEMVLWKEPSELPEQPHIVELAALLYDEDTAKRVESYHSIVRPDGWIISPENASIHGITHERAMDEGRPEHEVVEGFLALVYKSDHIVAHNAQFDNRIMRIATKRFGDGRATWQTLTQFEKDAIADDFKARKSVCTAKLSTKPCGLPPTPAMLAKGMRWNKTPTLTEAYKHFTGKELVGAHGALADATACAEVYFAIRSAS